MRHRLTGATGTPSMRSARHRWARAGHRPAEALPTREREDLLVELHALGWTDVEIAAHTRMTTYTTERIRDRLGLGANEGASD